MNKTRALLGISIAIVFVSICAQNSTTYAQSQKNVEITSPPDGQRIPSSQLTVRGIAEYSGLTDCVVYTLHDGLSRQAASPNVPGGPGDYSVWTYTFNSIHPGFNNLTAQLSCPNTVDSYDSILVYLIQGSGATVPGISENANSEQFANRPNSGL